MPKVTAEHEFPLSIDVLWSYIRDFGDTGKWSGRPKEACVRSGSGVGSLRRLHIANGQTIVDRLEDEQPYSYTYSVVEGDLPWSNYQARMAVEALNTSSTRFTWTGIFEPKGVSEQEAINFAKNVYAAGISMMKKTIPGAA